MKIAYFLITITFVSNSIQLEYKPDCQPKNTGKSYEKTLIVFAVDKNGLEDFKFANWYFLKQLACEIPISDNIRTYVMDYTKVSQNTVRTEDLYDSLKLIDALFENFELIDRSVSRIRFKETIDGFISQEAIEKHGNVHFIMPIVYQIDTPVFGKSTTMLFVLKNTAGMFSYTTGEGVGMFDSNEMKAPQHMVDVSKKIIAKILNEPIDNSEAGGSLVLTIIGFVLAVVFLIVAIAFIVLYIKEKSMRKHPQKDNK